jgi:hypothetical protein
MSHDFNHTALIHTSGDTNASDFELSVPADSASTSWDDAWIDIGGEG